MSFGRCVLFRHTSQSLVDFNPIVCTYCIAAANGRHRSAGERMPRERPLLSIGESEFLSDSSPELKLVSPPASSQPLSDVEVLV